MEADIDFAAAEAVIERIAALAEAFAQKAGVGGMETAGQMVSYLATHPRDIEPCLRFGLMELPADWFQHGCLTWHAANGKIVHPEYARRAAAVRRLLTAATPPKGGRHG